MQEWNSAGKKYLLSINLSWFREEICNKIKNAEILKIQLCLRLIKWFVSSSLPTISRLFWQNDRWSLTGGAIWWHEQKRCNLIVKLTAPGVAKQNSLGILSSSHLQRLLNVLLFFVNKWYSLECLGITKKRGHMREYFSHQTFCCENRMIQFSWFFYL